MKTFPQPYGRPATVERRAPKRFAVLRCLGPSAALAALCSVSPPAQAVDGCKVLLCLAAPSWRSVPECVPTIHELFHDLARGRPFPTCSMAGAGNSASQRWAAAPSYCPPQYTQVSDSESGPVYTCLYSGAIEVNVGGTLWSRTWWSFDGETVTDFTAAAKARLGNWDTTFDTDYATWLSAQPPVSSCSTC